MVSGAKGVAGRYRLGQERPRGRAARHGHKPVARTVARALEPASTQGKSIGQGGAMREGTFLGVDVCKGRLWVAVWSSRARL
jgi:hypothetical protein